MATWQITPSRSLHADLRTGTVATEEAYGVDGGRLGPALLILYRVRNDAGGVDGTRGTVLLAPLAEALLHRAALTGRMPVPRLVVPNPKVAIPR